MDTLLHKFYKYLFLSFFIIFSVVINAQTVVPEIVKSTEKALIGGKIFYVHTVQKGETLYSIARVYQVSMDEIISHNPAISSGLQPGQMLRIPESNVQTKQPDEYKGILHIVAAGQTIFSISRIYNVPVAEIEFLNPEVKYDSLQINQVLKIPGKPNVGILKSDKANFTIHIVEKKQTLYSLARKYNLTIKELVSFNSPNLDDGLRVGQEIKIPVKTEDVSKKEKADIQKEHTIVARQPDELSLQPDTLLLLPEVKDTLCNLKALEIKEKQINVSLLLPLFASASVSDISVSEEDMQNEENLQQIPLHEFNPLAINFIEFYQGFLIATDELKKKGINIHINVFDTEKDTRKLAAIANNAALAKSNIVIGPVYPAQVENFAVHANSKKYALVSPVAQHDVLTANNHNIFQVNPGIAAEYEKCAELLIADTSLNILIIYHGQLTADSSKNNAFSEILKRKIANQNIKVRELNVYGNDFSGIEAELDSMRGNIVFSPVADEIFVTTMLGQLVAKLIKYKIKSIGLQEWVSYKSADLNYLFDLQMTYFTPFYIDYKSEAIVDFMKRYRVYYGTDPIRISKYGFNYAMLGYDIGKYFISAYAYFGNDMACRHLCLSQLKLITPMHFWGHAQLTGHTNLQFRKVCFGENYNITAVQIYK